MVFGVWGGWCLGFGEGWMVFGVDGEVVWGGMDGVCVSPN